MRSRRDEPDGNDDGESGNRDGEGRQEDRSNANEKKKSEASGLEEGVSAARAVCAERESAGAMESQAVPVRKKAAVQASARVRRAIATVKRDSSLAKRAPLATARIKASGVLLDKSRVGVEVSGKSKANVRSGLKAAGKSSGPSETKPKTTDTAYPRVRTARHTSVVEEILKNVEKRLKGDDVKATLGDYIRLVQLQKELDEDEQPREIKVTWIEPISETESEAVRPEQAKKEAGLETVLTQTTIE